MLFYYRQSNPMCLVPAVVSMSVLWIKCRRSK